MTDWIEIPPDALIASHERANEIELFRSPFDVPCAMRVGYDAASQILTVQFRYIGDNEGRRRLELTDRVWFEIGRHSYRLFAVNVNVRALAAPGDLKRVMDEALAKMPERAKALASENYDATAEAIARNQPAIQQTLAAAVAG